MSLLIGISWALYFLFPSTGTWEDRLQKSSRVGTTSTARTIKSRCRSRSCHGRDTFLHINPSTPQHVSLTQVVPPILTNSLDHTLQTLPRHRYGTCHCIRCTNRFVLLTSEFTTYLLLLQLIQIASRQFFPVSPSLLLLCILTKITQRASGKHAWETMHPRRHQIRKDPLHPTRRQCNPAVL